MDVGHANVIASAGQELPADLADKADKIYTDPTSSLYAYGNKPVQVAKASAGRVVRRRGGWRRREPPMICAVKTLTPT